MVLAAAITLVCAVLVVAPSASPAGATPSAGDQTAADPVVAYIMSDEGVDQAVAKRRAAIESEASPLAAQMRKQFGNRFSSVYANKDSSLTVAVTRPVSTDLGVVTKAAAGLGLGRSDVKIKGAKYTEKQYKQGVAQVLHSMSGTVHAGFSVAADTVAETLTVTLPKTYASQQATARASLARSASSMTVLPVHIAFADPPQLKSIHDTGCDAFNECNAPLRGGIRISPNVTKGICTAGFNVRSRSNGVLYMLTAGHCLNSAVNAPYYGFQMGPPSGAHLLGPIHNEDYGNGAPYYSDEGIIQITNTAGWAARAWVLVYDGSAVAGSGPDPTRDYAYNISSDAGSAASDVRVCFTGEGSGTTNCGKVTNPYAGASYCDAHGENCVVVEELEKTNFCVRGGDSGGPVYAAHKGYGIIEGGSTTCGSGEYAFFVPLSKAEHDMNVNLATGT